MSNLTIFNFENTPIQTLIENNEIFFRATQLAELLQYKNPHDALRKHVDPDDLAKREIVNTINKRAQVLFVNESGMYSLVLSSKLERAKKIKRWVTSEVLPQIRKTGSYIQETIQIRPPERIINTEIPESDALRLASLWFALYKCRETLSTISEPLTALGSKLGSMAYTQATEYYNVLETTKQIIEPILDGIQSDDGHYQLALDTLRNHQIRRISRLAIR